MASNQDGEDSDAGGAGRWGLAWVQFRTYDLRVFVRHGKASRKQVNV